jgi:hypothetical protein
MRLFAASLAALLAVPTLTPAQPKSAKPTPAGEPQELGKFDDWIAATHPEQGREACYAFTVAKHSVPALAGRGEVVLTVTQRATGRDWVAISAGFTFRKDAAVTLQVDTAGFDFYTAQSSAFARDGKVVVAAFQKGEQAMARSPGPRDNQIVDTFSLRGFAAAYAAINKACPAR